MNRSRTFAFAFIFLHLVFCLESIYPRMVYCHKSDGTIVIEFELERGDCQCEKCEQCKEQRLARILGEVFPVSSVDHSAAGEDGNPCRHEDIHSEAAQSALNLVKKYAAAPPVLIPGPTEFDFFTIAPRRYGSATSNFLIASPAATGSILRC